MQVWQPGVDSIAAGEDLQYDPSTYDCMHQLTLDWPCMRCDSSCLASPGVVQCRPLQQMLRICYSRSFDVIKDKLGGPRSTFPHDLTIVAGTQAASANSNYIALLRFSNITQVGKHVVDLPIKPSTVS